MTADQVRAYVAAMWPEAMQSPVAKAIAAGNESEARRAMVPAEHSLTAQQVAGMDSVMGSLS